MATGWFAWTCLLVAAAPTPDDVVYLNHRGFQIPIKIKAEHAREVHELVLYYSLDQGRTWEMSTRASPDKKAFDFLAPADGLVYFSIAVVDKRGAQDPPDVYKAPVGLKACVDTVKPAVQITTAERVGEEVQVGWEITEDRPDWASLRLEYKAGGGKWVPLGVAAGERGSYRFKPPVPGDVTLRLALRDLAGNEGAAEKAVGGASSHHDRAVVGTGGVGPLPGRGEGAGKVEGVGKSEAPPPVGGTGQTPAPVSTGASPPLQVVNRRQVKLGFDVSKVGPFGLGSVDVYVTEDDGQTWAKAPGAPDVTLPTPGEGRQPVRGAVTVGLPKDGVRYGFYLVVKSGAGLGKPAPRPGTAPQVRLELDTTLPDAKLYAPEADTTRRDCVLLRWEASDRNLAGNPITLEYSEGANGPWAAIGEAEMPNTGKYSWQVGGKVPVQVYLKLTVRDAAGNTAVAQTDKPVPLDVTEPELGNVTVEPVGR